VLQPATFSGMSVIAVDLFGNKQIISFRITSIITHDIIHFNDALSLKRFIFRSDKVNSSSFTEVAFSLDVNDIEISCSALAKGHVPDVINAVWMRSRYCGHEAVCPLPFQPYRQAAPKHALRFDSSQTDVSHDLFVADTGWFRSSCGALLFRYVVKNDESY
jgi:hypothetical protein